MSIIGISGKMQSGKNTVASIIQYLVVKSQGYDMTWKYWNKKHLVSDKGAEIYSEWKQVAFAGKLKEIVSILTGIPVEDLEKPEVKNQLLGEEWIRYGYADGFIVKNGQNIMNNVTCSKEKYNEELKTNWQTAYAHHYTVRDLLQLVGTEAMRNVIHYDIWVNALFADYKPYCEKLISDENVNLQKCYRNPNWIITDMRFPNELQAIKNKGGITIRINRPEAFNLPTDGSGIKNRIESNLHPSETALDNAEFDYVIDNDGTIEELIEKVKEILIKEKII